MASYSADDACNYDVECYKNGTSFLSETLEGVKKIDENNKEYCQIKDGAENNEKYNNFYAQCKNQCENYISQGYNCGFKKPDHPIEYF